MWQQYVKEREGKETVEFPGEGFLCFSTHGEQCHIHDIFVVPEKRRCSVGTELADTVMNLAKERGCTHFTSTIIPSLKGANEAMFAHLSYGFKIVSAQADCIFMHKEF